MLLLLLVEEVLGILILNGCEINDKWKKMFKIF